MFSWDILLCSNLAIYPYEKNYWTCNFSIYMLTSDTHVLLTNCKHELLRKHIKQKCKRLFWIFRCDCTQKNRTNMFYCQLVGDDIIKICWKNQGHLHSPGHLHASSQCVTLVDLYGLFRHVITEIAMSIPNSNKFITGYISKKWNNHTIEIPA